MITRVVLVLVVACLAALALPITALAAPSNDSVSGAVWLQAGDTHVVWGYPASFEESTAGATTDAGEPLPANGGATVWFHIAPDCFGACSSIVAQTLNSDYDTILTLYCGSSVGTFLTPLASNDDYSYPDVLTSTLSYDPNSTTCNSDYWLQVSGYSGTTGNLELSVWSGLNDNLSATFSGWFNGAEDLGGNPTVSVTGDTWGATRESGEPYVQDDNAPVQLATQNTVWYTWTPTYRGLATVDTEGSQLESSGDQYDTVLGIYTGSAYGALSYVATNDDVNAPTDLTSQASFMTTPGTPYRIQVGSAFSDGGGPIALHIATTQPNDAFSAAATITTAKGTALGGTVGATRETGEPNPLGGSPSGSVWYRWTAPTTAGLQVDTAGSTADARLAVYTGSSLSGLTLVAADDNSGGGQTARVRFATVKGRVYWTQEDTVAGAGNVQVNWKTPTGDVQATQTGPATGAVGAAINYTVTVSNLGTQLASGVTVTDTLPSNAKLLSITPSSGTCGAPAGGVVTCKLGDMGAAATRTVVVSVGAGSPRTITNSAKVSFAGKDTSTANNATGDLSTILSTPARTTLASIADTGFTPATVAISPGWTVVWDVTGPGQHSILDGTGMGLFSLAGGGPPDYGVYRYFQAGTYAVTDGKSSSTESVRVKMTAVPATGTTATSFALTWGEGAPAAGFADDLQIQRPGTTTWKAYLTGTTLGALAYLPDSGAGTYKFRSRMRHISDNTASAWSPVLSITVS